MSKKDNIARDFLTDNHRFADLCNYYLFDGRQIIKPDDLQTQETTELISALNTTDKIFGVTYKELNVQKWRDILKRAVIKYTNDRIYVIIGIENQSEIHYAMPVRNMLYDALNYARQINQASKQHKKDKDYNNGAEFLSGFTKSDTLTPVITLTIYWADDNWDAPRSLYEMFGDKPKEILDFVADYKLNLITPNEITDFNKFKTSLGTVLEVIKYSKDEEAMAKLIENNPTFESLDIEAANIINIFTKLDISINQKEDKVNMCKAWEDHKLSGKREGSIETLIKHVLNMRSSGLSAEQAANMLGESPDTVNKIYDIATSLIPDCDIEKIYKELTKSIILT